MHEAVLRHPDGPAAVGPLADGRDARLRELSELRHDRPRGDVLHEVQSLATDGSLTTHTSQVTRMTDPTPAIDDDDVPTNPYVKLVPPVPEPAVTKGYNLPPMPPWNHALAALIIVPSTLFFALIPPIAGGGASAIATFAGCGAAVMAAFVYGSKLVERTLASLERLVARRLHDGEATYEVLERDIADKFNGLFAFAVVALLSGRVRDLERSGWVQSRLEKAGGHRVRVYGLAPWVKDGGT